MPSNQTFKARLEQAQPFIARLDKGVPIPGPVGPPGPQGPPGPIIPATTTTIGAVIIGANVNVQANGTISTPMASVFGRTGAVVAANGDYTAAQVTNAVSVLGSYADPTWITSLAWSKLTGVPATGVSSVFTRTGAVVAAAGDYTAAQVTNAVSVLGSYADPPWITALAWAKITGAPATGVSSVFTRTGAVVAANGDYTAAQITNAVSVLGSYANPPWITSLAWAKITGVPASATQGQTPWVSDIDGGAHVLRNVIYLSLNGPDTLNNTTPPQVLYSVVGTYRWGVGLRDPEAGANSGSNWGVHNFTDAGAIISLALVVQRATGYVGIAKTSPAYPLDVTGDVNITGAYRVGGVALPGNPYTAPVTALTTLTVPAATHGKGTTPAASCFDNSTPANAVAVAWSRAANGDVVFRWAEAFTGTVQIN